MKSISLILITILIITSTFFIDISENKNHLISAGKYTIVIHGGAGTISKSMPDSIKEDYLKSLSEALKIGKIILEKGGSSLEAVEQVIRFLEDNPMFNAGKGAVYTSEGTHELDASIMDGSNLSNGAVTLIKRVKNPITLARTVMEKTAHVLLGGEGADKFAEQMGLEMVPNNYFDTEQRNIQLLKEKEKKGTVGCVALDLNGNLAAGTSTGGLTNKMVGRIGDSPLINAGTYANNKTCAVSGTGTGEEFIRHTVAYNVSALMEYKGMTLKQAADEVIFKMLKKNDGGIIAVDRDGNYAMPFNSLGMYRGVATSGGVFEIKIWE
ncbi:MAG TPA: isoaspartyl peptidase/L-asparaginase [Ignavibacteriaceae bacterium]|nr:isoaspartyl peptidase/L-asparaginase [Ignavibacteriaceae bacterium]